MADTRSNPMSPSLAGIVSDPTDAARRIVPASQRADGSVRKERKVRPGHVPAEDVAKYRPGQGSLRAQHAVAQASHQAPPSPSPAPAAPIRRPNPSDFLAESKLRETTSNAAAVPNPTPSPTKASSKSGASSSRWAVASSVVEPAPAPSIAVPASPQLGNKPRTRGGPRQGKAPAMFPAHADTESQRPEEEQQQSAHLSEEAKENIQPEQPAAVQVHEPSVPSTPPSKIPELPETPGGDWWADDDEDDEVDAAAQALQGISIKDAASRQRPASPSPPSSTATTSSRGPPVQHNASNRQSNTSNHTHRESHAPKSAKKSQSNNNTHNNKTPNGSKAPTGNLLSRLGPPVPLQQQPVEKPAITAPKESASIAKMTIEEIKSKAKSISQELRQMNQLKKYAGAGAVLSNDQRSQIDNSQALSRELGELKLAADSLASELAQLIEASQ